jgi:hypothetical protein
MQVFKLKKNSFMKQALNILLISGLLCSALSCKKDLAMEPTDFIAPEFFYNTEDQLNQSLIAVYNTLQTNALYGASSNHLFMQWLAGCDDAFNLTGSTNVPQKYDYNASFTGVADVWNALYRGVERANALLENINKPDMPEERRKIIHGEAKFLRAYFYFMLVSNYGDVPLKTSSSKSVNELSFPRDPAAKVYDFILKEMEEAEQMVLPISSFTHSGRVTQSAVQGVLARVCLYKAGAPNNDVSKYSDALKWARKVIESGLHSLNPDYRQVFINYIQDKYDTRENLWEVEFFSTGVGDFFTRYGGWGSYNGIRQLNTDFGYSNGALQAYPQLQQKFDPHDVRRDWSIASYQYVNDQGPNKNYWRDDQQYERRIGKWRREYELQEKKITNFTSTNYAVVRYSDVLLMAAEAENYLNGPANAIAYVNEVRRRGYGKNLNGETLSSIIINNGGTGYTTPPVVTLSGGGASTQATAVATVTEGVVTNIAIVSRGQNYTSAPDITITGNGTGATASSILSQTDDDLLEPAEYASKEAMQQTIMDERARELAFEGHRRYDLIRWGILIKTVKDLAADITANAPANFKPLAVIGDNITERHIYIPIPLREINLNPQMTQTPGWE